MTVTSILSQLFKHCHWDNQIARYGALFFVVFMANIIWFYVDKYQQQQEKATKPTKQII
jgi:hypothetical protein